MSHLTNRLTDLQARLTAAWSALQLDDVKQKINELEARMAAPDFWSNQAQARSVSQDAADLKKEWAEWDDFRRTLSELGDVEKLASEENDESALKDVEESLAKLEEQFGKMEFQMLLSGPYDTRNAIISIHAGAGGTDAMDWTAMLLRMFSRFAETRGWTIETIDESRGEEAGFKSVTIAVRGRFAYGWLRSESGVHRLVRISPFDAEQMRHTTFALVEVLPEFAEVDEKAVEIDPDDLRIDTFMSSGKGGQSVNTTYSAVRVTHLPTGISVSCQNERSQSQNKDTALGILKAKLYQMMVAERAEKLSDIKGDHKTAAWGNQIRSYVLHPYKLVKDHRTDVETNNPEAVLNGELTPFMEAFLRLDVESRRAA